MNHKAEKTMLVVILLGMSMLGGCMSAPLQPGQIPPPGSATVDMPPKQVLAEVKRIVSSAPLDLGVLEEHDGVILTGYERHRGDFHIGRHWQERTQYRIAIIPDWNDPAGRARIEVSALSEERAAEGQRWDPNPALHRPERARAMLEKLTSQLKPGAAR